MSSDLRRYCLCLTPTPTPGTRAAVLNAARWQPRSIITIKFLGGDPSLQKRVKDVAAEWEKISRLTFSYVTEGNAVIRIAFVQGDGSWSYLGTQCHQITDQSAPTMNFGWLTPQSPDDELKRVVLHEFGHALGLIHEHQNPQGAIKWNKVAVRKDLSGSPNFWDDATIERNMFELYSTGAVTATPVDKDSIMLYVIPESWTEDGFSSTLNSKLSDQDRELIRQVYA